MREVATNIRILKSSRKRLAPGDVFAVQMPDDLYSFGRVIKTDVPIHAMTRNILIYVFQTRSESKDVPPRELLRPEQLLMPPLLINRLPWSRGYFEHLGNLPLEAGEVLPVHCFWSFSRKVHYDDAGNVLPGPVGPVGSHELNSFRTFDDKISDALGVPTVPKRVA
ncbi:immunity 26/phosphotriesterase HocA family protein [Amycolatopsis sp. 3B14]|uniref:immunity 26/phosphotriesterase HocA family protein n=1 Tax=Amycolatopsis sp. 3B14 TaxID=3243600 RepID=UPI003D95D979